MLSLDLNAAPGIFPSRHTILYVEDNLANFTLVAQLIARRADLVLVTAADGNAGINMARDQLPDLVLMDINLPGMNGLEALKVLRQDPSTAHIPVIALSSDAYPRQIEKGLHAGFIAYLTKPFKLEDLLHAIDSALDLD